jgi:hypothetical protein
MGEQHAERATSLKNFYFVLAEQVIEVSTLVLRKKMLVFRGALNKKIEMLMAFLRSLRIFMKMRYPDCEG